MTSIPGNEIVIVDSDALIGLIHENDELHNRCLAVSNYLSSNSLATIIPYPIVLEAAATLARDKTIKRPDLAARLLSDYASVEEAPFYDQDVSADVARLYNPKTSKRNSPFDHYVLALAKKNAIKYVFSFDTFYKKNGLALAEELLKS